MFLGVHLLLVAHAAAQREQRTTIYGAKHATGQRIPFNEEGF